MPEGKAVLNPLESEVTLFLRTTGFRHIMARTGASSYNIDVDVNNVDNNGYLLTRNLLDRVGYDLPDEVRITMIQPDTLHLKFDKKVSKTLPVQPLLELTFSPRFDLKTSVEVVPDSVYVEGPVSILDTMTYWLTNPIRFQQLDASVSMAVNFGVTRFPTVATKPAMGKVTIDVEEFTEQTYQAVPVKVTNVPDSVSIRIFPESIKATFQVGFSSYDAVLEAPFMAVANFEGIRIGEDKYVTVELITYPDYIKNIRIEPTSVEYLVLE